MPHKTYLEKRGTVLATQENLCLLILCANEYSVIILQIVCLTFERGEREGAAIVIFLYVYSYLHFLYLCFVFVFVIQSLTFEIEGKEKEPPSASQLIISWSACPHTLHNPIFQVSHFQTLNLFFFISCC